MSMSMWVVTLYGLIGRYQRFGETYFSPEDGDVSPKCWYLLTSPQSVATQKTNVYGLSDILHGLLLTMS
jgi:hypothetical protein